MNRKNNPWVSLAALLLLALVLVFVCTGCRKEAENTQPRFTEEKMYHEKLSGKRAYIITDTETGRQYLLYANANASGMAALED
jgi:membrane protein implicated in regulation of membrane protease activity